MGKRCRVSRNSCNLGCGVIRRSRALNCRLAALIILALLNFLDPAFADEDPPKQIAEPAGRTGRRPPTARIQTDLGLASLTSTEFRDPVELAYRDFNELVLQVGTFENVNAAQLQLPTRFQLLCYN